MELSFIVAMRFGSILKNHEQFESGVEEIIQYAQELIADLPYRTRLSAKEKHILLESLILRICALWEKFIEAQIISTICLDTRRLLEVMELKPNTKLNPELVRAVIFSDTFRSFRNIDNLIYYSQKVVVEKYNPFRRITQSQKKNIHFTYKIRNYLSHYSGFSKRALFSAYKKIYRYKRFLEPGKFLLKHRGKHFEDLAKSFKMTSMHIKTVFKQGSTL